MAPAQKPGQTPAKPGEYIESGPRGGEIPNPRHATIKPNTTKLPPTPKPGHTWKPEGKPKK